MQKTNYRTYNHARSSITNVNANTGYALVTPAENVRGCIVRRASFANSITAAGALQASILCKSAAPATVIDGDVLALSVPTYGDPSAYHMHGMIEDVFVPAGLGVYFVSAQATVRLHTAIIAELL